ncbi:Rieske (2Fe-2S) protein [Gemmatimonas sp.]|uniref:QcrA and Rieske domain-containing protein n=1 Tax=Gemmatimonas sp. TaxID=1962908 RepID=UPI0022BF9A42|nr:Rieske (2Fe-2S) protein [Gemmatimonas sp.]MCZ8203606.1 Rieske (2Fe-2S) protein [Gemmatimonas sp.]
MSNMPPDNSASACDGCTARRAFLRQSLTTGAAMAGWALFGPVSTVQALAVRPGGRGPVKYPLPAADGVSIDGTNEVILCRAGGEVFAFALSCPHQNTALKVLPKGAGFQCPRHKSKYQPNGTFVSGRATRNMDRLQITRDGNTLTVDPDLAFESDTDPARWAAASIKL